jgi:hypothetical protein
VGAAFALAHDAHRLLTHVVKLSAVAVRGWQLLGRRIGGGGVSVWSWSLSPARLPSWTLPNVNLTHYGFILVRVN